MSRRFGLAGGLALFCLATAPAAAPQEQRPDVFRGGVTAVNVDVYPRRDGRIVEGLRAEDFHVFEDGKPQHIDHIEFIRAEPNTPEAARRDPGSRQEGEDQAADPHNRVFIIYLDRYHTTFEGAHAIRGPLLEFMGRTISATDLFAVMTADLSPRQLVFGRQTETLESELTKYADWGLRGKPISVVDRPAMEQQLETCLSPNSQSLDSGDVLVALYREDVMSTGLEELMMRLRDLRDERKNVLFVSEGWTPLEPQTMLANLASGDIPNIGTGRGGVLGLDPARERNIGPGQSWCDQQYVRLSHIDFQERFKNLLTLASRANVSFYPIDIGGLRTGLAPLSRRAPALTKADELANTIQAKLERPSVTTLRELAENTGGRAIVETNDLGAGLHAIADDLSAYYLIGYSSTNTALDGKYRRIDVKIDGQGISVAARKGYLAASVDPRAAGSVPAAGAATVASAAVTDELARLARVRPDADFFTYAVKRADGLDVVVELSVRKLEQGRWQKGAEAQATLLGDGSAPASASGRLEPVARGAILHVPVAAGDAGPWRVAVRVADATDEATDRVEVAAPAATGPLLGAPMAFRGTSAPSVPLRPVADFQFRRNERIRAQWPLLGAIDNRTARVLDRAGQPVALQANVTEASGAVNVDLNLAPLSEGDYLLELSAAQGSRTERRLLAFRIVR